MCYTKNVWRIDLSNNNKWSNEETKTKFIMIYLPILKNKKAEINQVLSF